jgi:hypothetical protein
MSASGASRRSDCFAASVTAFTGGLVAVAAVEYPAFEELDGFEDAVAADVFAEFGEPRRVDHW